MGVGLIYTAKSGRFVLEAPFSYLCGKTNFYFKSQIFMVEIFEICSSFDFRQFESCKIRENVKFLSFHDF